MDRGLGRFASFHTKILGSTQKTKTQKNQNTKCVVLRKLLIQFGWIHRSISLLLNLFLFSSPYLIIIIIYSLPLSLSLSLSLPPFFFSLSPSFFGSNCSFCRLAGLRLGTISSRTSLSLSLGEFRFCFWFQIGQAQLLRH